PWHRRLSVREALQRVPALRSAGLRSAFTYLDGHAPYPERLSLQTVLEARDAGAVALNHVSVDGLRTQDRRATGVHISVNGGFGLEVPARLVVNAAGPWVDAVLRTAGRFPRLVGGTKGAHVVLDLGGNGPRCAIYAEARSDGRPFFVIPWRGCHLVGTTDR